MPLDLGTIVCLQNLRSTNESEQLEKVKGHSICSLGLEGSEVAELVVPAENAGTLFGK